MSAEKCNPAGTPITLTESQVGELLKLIDRALDNCPAQVLDADDLFRQYNGAVFPDLPERFLPRGNAKDAKDCSETLMHWLRLYLRPILKMVADEGLSGLLTRGLQPAKAFPETPGQVAAHAALNAAILKDSDCHHKKTWALMEKAQKEDDKATKACDEYRRQCPAHALWFLSRQEWFMGEDAAKAPDWPEIEQLTDSDRRTFRLLIVESEAVLQVSTMTSFAEAREWFTDSLRWLRRVCNPLSAPVTPTAQPAGWPDSLREVAHEVDKLFAPGHHKEFFQKNRLAFVQEEATRRQQTQTAEEATRRQQTQTAEDWPGPNPSLPTMVGLLSALHDACLPHAPQILGLNTADGVEAFSGSDDGTKSLFLARCWCAAAKDDQGRIDTLQACLNHVKAALPATAPSREVLAATEQAPDQTHKAQGGGAMEPLDKAAATAESRRGMGRRWTQPHCPSCGLERIVFITQKDFYSKRSAPSKNTVNRYVREGKYWSDVRGRVPWCEECGLKTPEGDGVAAVPGATSSSFRPSTDEMATLASWAKEAVMKCRYELPEGCAPGSKREEYGEEMLATVLSAIADEATRRGRMLTRDEVEEVAKRAIAEAKRQTATAEHENAAWQYHKTVETGEEDDPDRE